MPSIRSLSCALLVVGILVSACTTTKQAGDGCRLDSDPSVCIDATTAGSCRAFTWHVDACRGPAGCSAGACDQSIAAKDDGCVDGARACSTSGTEVLHCVHNAMVPERVCRGERGCYQPSPSSPPACDLGRPQIGDACVSEAGARCSEDGKAWLTCSEDTHHIILGRRCLGARGCQEIGPPHNGHPAIRCDITVGDIGEPCEGYVGVGTGIGDGGDYCSSDGHELLTCKAGILVPSQTCECVVHWKDSAAYTEYSAYCDDPLPRKPRSASRRGLEHGLEP